jgi:hypothetical protein
MPEVLHVRCTGKGAGEGACAGKGGGEGVGEGGAEGAGEGGAAGVCGATRGTMIEGTLSRNS